jgi:OOP family OmpA-OmpF porin
MARSPYVFLALSLISVGLAAWFIAAATVRQIEVSARENALTGLAAAGQNWASADPDGLKLILSGEAPDEASRFRALDVLGQIVSASRITDRTTLATARLVELPPLRLLIFRDGAAVALSGQVAGDGDRAELLVRAATIASEVDARLLAAVPAEPQAEWRAAEDFAFSLLALIEKGRLTVTPGRVELRAVAPSDAVRATLEQQLVAMQPGNVTFSLSVLAPLPVRSPFEFAMALEGAVAEISSCSAETSAGRARILSAVARAGASLPRDCPLALGAPTTDWPAAIDLSVTALAEAGGGVLTVRNSAISLTAPPGTDAGRLEQIGADLRSSLPQGYSLSVSIRTETAEPVIAERFLFSASRNSDGAITLSGSLPDAASRTAATTYAGSLTRDGRIVSRVELDSHLPEGWITEALAAIETLSLLHAGTVTVSTEKIYVEGRSASPDIEAEVTDVLRSRLASGRATSVLVVTDPSLSETVTPPANTECADEIAEILKSRQIAFAPNSPKIAPESEPVIDDIAIVLSNCATASFEIGGHTDSQGGEVLNQALSQARAEAVLDALLARDVLISHMSARGYGESQPIGDNETEAGRALNRRIAFKLMENSDEQE